MAFVPGFTGDPRKLARDTLEGFIARVERLGATVKLKLQSTEPVCRGYTLARYTLELEAEYPNAGDREAQEKSPHPGEPAR